MDHALLAWSRFMAYIFGVWHLGSSHYILRMTGPPMCWNYVWWEKKSSHLSFFSSDMQDSFYLTCPFLLLKIAIFTENLSIFPFLFFFPPTLAGQEIFFFYFFPPTWEKSPCRDPSSIEYNASCLTSLLLIKKGNWYDKASTFCHNFFISTFG